MKKFQSEGSRGKLLVFFQGGQHDWGSAMFGGWFGFEMEPY